MIVNFFLKTKSNSVFVLLAKYSSMCVCGGFFFDEYEWLTWTPKRKGFGLERKSSPPTVCGVVIRGQ